MGQTRCRGCSKRGRLMGCLGAEQSWGTRGHVWARCWPHRRTTSAIAKRRSSCSSIRCASTAATGRMANGPLQSSFHGGANTMAGSMAVRMISAGTEETPRNRKVLGETLAGSPELRQLCPQARPSTAGTGCADGVKTTTGSPTPTSQGQVLQVWHRESVAGGSKTRAPQEQLPTRSRF